MNKTIKFVLISIISFYQKTISPDHGIFKARHPHGFCKFYPSCSQYSKECLQKFSVPKALFLTIKRLVRCHPWAEPKVDPVPNI